VRELQNVNRNMVVMNYVGEVPAAMLPPRIVSLAPSGGSLEGPTPHMTSTLQSADAQGTIPQQYAGWRRRISKFLRQPFIAKAPNGMRPTRRPN
jgi:hypothetical protein